MRGSGKAAGLGTDWRVGDSVGGPCRAARMPPFEIKQKRAAVQWLGNSGGDDLSRLGVGRALYPAFQ